MILLSMYMKIKMIQYSTMMTKEMRLNGIFKWMMPTDPSKIKEGLMNMMNPLYFKEWYTTRSGAPQQWSRQ